MKKTKMVKFRKQIDSFVGAEKEYFIMLAYITQDEEIALGYLQSFIDIHNDYMDTGRIY